LDDSEWNIPAESRVGMDCEEWQEFDYLLEGELGHAGSIPAAQRFRGGKESFADLGDLERPMLQQAIERPPPAARDPLEHEHDTTFGNGFIEPRREQHMDLEGNPCAGTRKLGGVLRPDGLAGSCGRARAGLLRGRKRRRAWGWGGALDGMESHGDGMSAQGAPLSRGAAGAKIVDVDGILDHEAGAIAGVIGLDDAAQGGWSPI